MLSRDADAILIGHMSGRRSEHYFYYQAPYKRGEFKAAMDKNIFLIVEDDADIRSGIGDLFKKPGNMTYLRQAMESRVWRSLKKKKIDLAIVDIMMPRMDGLTMMMKVREKGYDFPVIMLSAKSEEVDKIMGLNMGADDYITKPFTPLELLARVNSHLRRYNRYREAIASAEPVKDTYHVLGGIELNEETVEVFVDGAPVRLTPIEFKILLLLMRNPGRVFPQTKFTNASGMKKRSILTRLWFMSVKSEKK